MIIPMKKLDKAYWENKYRSDQLGWDMGQVSPPLKAYIDQLSDKTVKILIPGAGNGYEALYLFRRGFTSVYVVDIAKQPLTRIEVEEPDFPTSHLIEADFFEWGASGFDLILEQTFFCALQPSQRRAYVDKMKRSLRPGGTLAGLFFDFPLTENGPPFGGNEAEYRSLFATDFHIRTLERAHNSIKPRQGTELFFIFERKSLT